MSTTGLEVFDTTVQKTHIWLHKTPCGRTRRGDRLGPSPQLSIRANCLNLNQKKCKFLLCCRCCQAPWHIFFFPLCFSLHTVFFRKYFICPMFISAHLSSATVTAIGS